MQTVICYSYVCFVCKTQMISPIGVKVMVVCATFNTISVILWWSVLLVEESVVPTENHQPTSSH